MFKMYILMIREIDLVCVNFVEGKFFIYYDNKMF